MIGYACIGTNDLAKARAYYDALFGSIGGTRLMEFPDEQGGFTLYGLSWGKPGVAVTTPYNKAPATAGNGNMIAIVMDSRDKVDAFYTKALELGGTDEGGNDLAVAAGAVERLLDRQHVGVVGGLFNEPHDRLEALVRVNEQYIALRNVFEHTDARVDQGRGPRRPGFVAQRVEALKVGQLHECRQVERTRRGVNV